MTAAYEVVNLRQRLAVRKYLFRPLGSVLLHRASQFRG